MKPQTYSATIPRILRAACAHFIAFVWLVLLAVIALTIYFPGLVLVKLGELFVIVGHWLRFVLESAGNALEHKLE